MQKCKIFYVLGDKLTFVAFISFLFSSCYTLYRPNTMHVPLFKEKNEFSLNAGASFSGTEIQAAYSVTNNVAVMVNGSFINANVAEPTGIYRRENNFGELGLGYFQHLGENVIGEVFSGFGFGKAYNQGNFWVNNSSFNRADYTRYFVQPSIGFVSNTIELAAGLRWSYVDFFNFKSESSFQNSYNLPTRSSYAFIEPAFTARVGFKSIKIFGQIGASFPTVSIPYAYSPIIFSTGLNIKIASRYKNNPTHTSNNTVQ